MAPNNEGMQESKNDEQQDKKKDDIFSVEEIKIEEMAVDGICGVY